MTSALLITFVANVVLVISLARFQLQAPSNQLTSKLTQQHLDIDSSNQENSSNFISLNDLINNIPINDKGYIKPSANYAANVSYHTPQSINSLLQPFHNETKIFLIHFKCISLQKNVDTLRLYLDNLAYKPDIIMVSETKLKRGSLLINIEIKGYIFFHADSITNAGGVGIYVKCKFNRCIYDDVSQIHGSEYIFIKLRLKTSDYVFGVVYRHPTYSSENFLKFENSFNDVVGNRFLDQERAD